MFTKILKTWCTLAAMVFVGLGGAKPAQATTTYDINGEFYGTLVGDSPADGFAKFNSSISGQAIHDDLAKTFELILSFNGFTSDDGLAHPDNGTISGEVHYTYNNVELVSLNGHDFLTSVTDKNNSNDPSDGHGSGTLTLTIDMPATAYNGNQALNGTFMQMGGAMPTDINEGNNCAAFGDLCSGFLIPKGEDPYFIVGLFPFFDGSHDTLHAWFMSGANVGDRYHVLATDGHTTATLHTNEVPEPGTLGLLSLGLIGGAIRRRRKHTA